MVHPTPPHRRPLAWPGHSPSAPPGQLGGSPLTTSYCTGWGDQEQPAVTVKESERERM